MLAFRKTLSLVLLVLITVTSALHSQTAFRYTTVPNDPLGTRIYTLPNGLRAILTANAREPKVQSYVVTLAGSKNDPADATGLAHYLEHMLFKGSDVMGTNNYAKEQPLLQEIVALYEEYRTTTNPAKRAAIYHKIDSVSGVAATYAIPNEFDKASQILGCKGTNAFTSTDITAYTNEVPANRLKSYLRLERERFRNPVMRLFHTELEAVYEEKNISLGEDGSLLYDTLNAMVFGKHTYGSQSTIGTVEHLKNPSLVRIQEFYNTYYVPNNMVVVLAGDINYDSTIAWINEAFGDKKSTTLAPWKIVELLPITSPIEKTIIGNEASEVTFAYRWPKSTHPDLPALKMMDLVLSNGTAGLIDLNIKQVQACLDPFSYQDVRADYGMHRFGGKPLPGQTLKDVRRLLMAQIELVQKGAFSDSLLVSIIRDLRKQRARTLETNDGIASLGIESLSLNMPYDAVLNSIDAMSKVTKADIIRVAKQYYKNNYVTLFKEKGERVDAPKVEKPAITPVVLNRDQESPFIRDLAAEKVTPIQPVFVDFSKEVTTTKLKNSVELLSNQDTKTELYTLVYRFPFGSFSSPELEHALTYWQFLGTSDYSNDRVQEMKYWLATNISANVGDEHTTITLSGIDETFEESVRFLEGLLTKAKANPQALQAYIQSAIQERTNNIANKDMLFQVGLYNYATYGKSSPYLHDISNADLQTLDAQKMTDIITRMVKYPHQILYTGKRSATSLAAILQSVHATSISLPAPKNKMPEERIGNQNEVFVIDYDMPQAEILMLSKALPRYDSSAVPSSSLFNEYYDGGMGAIVFQTLRESKALAYSTFLRIGIPTDTVKSVITTAYIGTQADKLHESVTALNELLNTLPVDEAGFQRAKSSLLTSIATQRNVGMDNISMYLNAKRRGVTTDQRKYTYTIVPQMQFADIQAMFTARVANKPHTMCVCGSLKNIDIKSLEKYGPVTVLKPSELFSW